MSSTLTLWTVLFSGLAAGALHVLTGPDHLAAVAPLAVNNRTRSWTIGLRWGLGHASGVCLVALAGIFLKQFIPMEKISGMSERLVGVLLVAIGIWGLRKAYRMTIHTHSHAPDSHSHVHVHFQGKQHQGHTHAAIGIGILHGLAGGSHFLGVLPALAMPTQVMSILYIVSFGIGTIISMMTFAECLGRVSLFSGIHMKKLMISFSSVSMLVGVYWIVSI